jgi:thiopeptide-type bacteriocin biosynthesis protein
MIAFRFKSQKAMEHPSAYKFHSQVIIRTPFYDCSSYQQPLRDIVKDPYFLAAICVSSKSLFDALKRNDFEIARLSDKERSSVKMYFNRMCFLPTPFGLSSGITVARWSPEDDLYLVNCPELHCMFDYSSSLLIAERIINEIRDFKPSYVLNKTFYKVNNEFRYLRIMQNKQGKGEVIVDSIELTEIIVNVLSYFNKKRTKAGLIGFLMKEYQVSFEDGAEFTEELIDKQIIWPEFYPNITGESYLSRVNGIAHDLNYKSTEYLTIKYSLDQVSQSPLSKISNNLTLFEEQVKQLICLKDSTKNPIYLNIERKCAKGGVDCSWQRKILDGLSVLKKIIPPYKNGDLLRFVSDFKKKFDLRWVPLLVALDPEVGIDYHSLSRTIDSSSLLKDVQLEYPCSSIQRVQWSQVHTILLKKWGSLSQAKSEVPTIVLEDKDLGTFSKQGPDLHTPPSISVLFRTAGNMVYIEEAGGCSAISINGRFTAFNQEIKQASEGLSAIEESVNPEVIFAEIAYCTNPKMADINRRANLRRYEIPILIGSDLPEERQIPLNDLWTSVVNDEIILWSGKLHKRVIPRLSSAFNYLRSDLPAFRFLCDMQFQGIQPSFTLDLSEIFPGLDFYPRVEYKETILHLASWYFNKSHFSKILSNPDEQVRLSVLKEMVTEMRWPKFISIHQFDNYVVIDTSKDQELEFLINVIKKGDDIIIKEFPFLSKKNSSQNHISKRYIKQYIASIYNDQTIYHHLNPVFEEISSFKPVDRKLLPGSQWIYFKIYCHPSRANQLLVRNILPLFNRWLGSSFLKQWFFVRYGDPEYHLRVRLNTDPVNTGLLIRGLTNTLAPLVNAGIISDLQTSVYERELERYGSDIIQDLERSFCSSTHLICKFFNILMENGTEDYPLFKFTHVTLNILLNSFKCGLADKSRLFEQFYHNMYLEFRCSDKTKDQLKRKFREIRDKNEFFLEQDLIDKYKISAETEYFRHTHRQLNHLTNDWPLSRKDELVGDIIHMHLNRVFSTSTRRNELVVYYCLWRHFASELGRQNNNLLKPLAAK